MEINIFDLAKSIPIDRVIGHHVALKYKGRSAYGLCPFHNDKHIGSFVVNINKGKFACYACGAKGDGVDFISHFRGIDSYEAAISICDEEGLISHSDAMDLREVRGKKVTVGNSPYKVYHKPELLLSPKGTPEHLDTVYRCFVRAAGNLPDVMKRVLTEERKLSENELDDFFPFPQRYEQGAFWKRFRMELASTFDIQDEDIQKKLLLGVPGFFLNKDCEVNFATNSMPCIGIVIHSRDGKVSGLQLRKMGELEGKQARYTLFSSGFADGTGKYGAAYGCNSGYIEDVLYPRIKWNGTIALTEGRFKAITLSKMGFLVVNMHSISNWDPAGDVALELTDRYPKTKRFMLAYDSEHNPAVFKSAGSLYDKLSKCRPVLFATWDPAYGKGIDDVVNSGNAAHLKSVTADKFFKKAG